MDEQNQNLPIFEIKLRFFKLKKNFQKFSKFYNFENHQISIIDKLKKNNIISELVEFQKGEGQNLERRDVERSIFRNFKITNIKITKYELFDSFILKFIFSLFINYLIIFQIVKY